MLYADRARRKCVRKGSKQLLAALNQLAKRKPQEQASIQAFCFRANRILEGAKTKTAECYRELSQLRHDIAKCKLMTWDMLAKMENGHPQPCNCGDCLMEVIYPNETDGMFEVSDGMAKAAARN